MQKLDLYLAKKAKDDPRFGLLARLLRGEVEGKEFIEKVDKLKDERPEIFPKDDDNTPA